MMIKRIVASVTMGVMLLSSTYCFASDNEFTDISDLAAKDKVIALQDKGLIKGVGDNLFNPYASITAAEGVQFIVNAFNLNLDLVRFIKEPKATDYFVNADNNAWYANAFIIASVNGLELPNALDPNKNWTNEEFTYYLVKTMETKNNLPMLKINPVDIADGDQITVDYSGAIQRSLIYGVTKLDSWKNFNPKSEITRAQAAERVYNALEYIKAHPAPIIESEN